MFGPAFISLVNDLVQNRFFLNYYYDHRYIGSTNMPYIGR